VKRRTISNIQFPGREKQYPITNNQYPISKVQKRPFPSSSYLDIGDWLLDIGYSSYSHLDIIFPLLIINSKGNRI
jgi:hypothetical protein